MIICSCEGISEKEIRRAARCGADSVEKLGRLCGAGTGCDGCHRDLQTIINQEKALQLSQASYLSDALPMNL